VRTPLDDIISSVTPCGLVAEHRLETTHTPRGLLVVKETRSVLTPDLKTRPFESCRLQRDGGLR